VEEKIFHELPYLGLRLVGIIVQIAGTMDEDVDTAVPLHRKKLVPVADVRNRHRSRVSIKQ